MENTKDTVKISIKTSGIDEPNKAWVEYINAEGVHEDVYTEASLKHGTYINISCDIPEGKAVKKVLINSLNVLLTPQQVVANSNNRGRVILVSINKIVDDLDIEVVFGNEERILSWDFYQEGLFEVWSSDYYTDIENSGQDPEDGTHKWPDDNYGTGKQYKNGDVIEEGSNLYIFPKNINNFKINCYTYYGNTKESYIVPEHSYEELSMYGSLLIMIYGDSFLEDRSMHITSINDKSYSTITNSEFGKISVDNQKVSCTAGDHGVLLYWYTIQRSQDASYINMFTENIIDFYPNRTYTAIFKNYTNLDIIKVNLNKRCLNCLNNNFAVCSLPKEFISDILLIDAIDSAITSSNTYILDNIVNKFSNIYPYEQCQSKCKLCQ